MHGYSVDLDQCQLLWVAPQSSPKRFTLECQRLFHFLRGAVGQSPEDLLGTLLYLHVRMPGLEPDAFSLED
jgi:hypothetical protein